MVELKPGWRRVKLGDAVQRHVERVDTIDDYRYFVGVDALDSETLRLRRWGRIGHDEIPPTFRFAFRQGMVLFPTRRPRLRKCAIAPFSGLTGEKVLVLQPLINGILFPPLAAFILSSLRVQEWAIKCEIGSVTPHFRWNDLAQCEIALPPFEEQLRYSEALSAAEMAYQAVCDLASTASCAADAFAAAAFRGEGRRDMRAHPRLGLVSSDWPVVTIGDVTESSQYGLSTVPQEAGRYPLLRMMNIVDGCVVENDLRYIDLSDDSFSAYHLENGDVLFNRTNSIELVGRTGVYTLEGEHVFASYLVRIKVKCATVSPEYLTAYLNAPLGRQQVLSFATKAVSQANVSASNLAKVLMPLPPRDIQDRIVADLLRLKQAQHQAMERAQQVAIIRRSILQDLTGPVEASQ